MSRLLAKVFSRSDDLLSEACTCSSLTEEKYSLNATSSKPDYLIPATSSDLLTFTSDCLGDVFERFVHVSPLLLSLLSDTAPHTTPLS